ncbi:MAG: alpha-L-rhamnosidase C-terminal domain-containing protein [bacterium]
MKTMAMGMMLAVQMLAGVSVAAVTDAGSLPVPERSGKEGDAAWLRQAREHVLTPTNDWVAPVCVMRTEGNVEGADGLLRSDGRSCRLTFETGGVKPVAILDFGKQGVGGFAVFTVTAKTGLPVVRLAYACHPDGIGETGCTDRGSRATYLGGEVDLPVLPANVNRHETYSIPRTGRFIAPLVQGHTRYVRVQLDTPGTSVEIDSVALVNREVYDRSPHDGYFLCSDERLNRLWYISTWTLQIASLPNQNAWKTIDGWLLPRKLEQADEIGLSTAGGKWGDVAVETSFELRANPHYVAAAGVAFRAKDARNAYTAEVALDGAFKLRKRINGKDTVISEKKLKEPLIDGQPYKLEISALGPVLTTRLDGAVIDESRDDTFAAGSVGFYTPKEKWPLFDTITVKDGKGQKLLADDFSGDLSQWQFARTLSSVVDGGKRDRLLWTGDLYFAQRSVYNAFANPTYMRDSLKMMAFNQTPEGYVHASPYAERSVPPPSGDFGPFPSDEFAAWLAPVAWDHLLYTDDVDTLRKIYPAIKRVEGYLGSRIGENGLFVQRAETSKHACNLELGDVRTRSYMNILLWGVFRDTARIAGRLGLADDAQASQKKADALKKAIFERFWDEANGCFREALETAKSGSEANALALSMRFVSQDQALRIARQLGKNDHGKFQSLASRGRFEYGFGQSGMQAIFDHHWLQLLDPGWKGTATTSECMNMRTRGWFDESHPDTAIATHFSAYILGVTPTAPGFSRFQVRPAPVKEVTWARGVVPTPHGPVMAGWENDGRTFKLSLTVPRDTQADVVLPKGGTVLVNGKPGDVLGLKKGVYEIEVRNLPADAWADPALAVK